MRAGSDNVTQRNPATGPNRVPQRSATPGGHRVLRYGGPRPRMPALAAASMVCLAAMAGGAAGAPSIAAADGHLDERTVQRLEAALSRSMHGLRAPGVVAGVWVGDRGWTAVRGRATASARRAPSPAMHTRVGSVTKTMVGTLVLRLADEGRLGLDDTIERWFPEVPDARTITIRDLATMASGIDSYTADDAVVDRFLAQPRTPWTPGELIAAGVSRPRTFAPGNGFQYSNTNFVMLGHIIERVTGMSVGRALQAKVFAPLGMRHTSYPSGTALPGPHWRGYTVQGSSDGSRRDATNWSPTFGGAAGEVVSTLGDLRLWTRAVGTGALLRPATQRNRLIENPASVKGRRAYLFALGRESGWLAHSGEIPGFNTQVAYLPSKRISIVVMANSDIPGITGANPAPAVFAALAKVVAPRNAPVG